MGGRSRGATRRRRATREETKRPAEPKTKTNATTRMMTSVSTMTGRDYRPASAGLPSPVRDLSSFWLTTTDEPAGAMLTP